MAMERIALVTDSSCDASDEELAELGVECVHLQVTAADGTPFPVDNTPENIEAFYDYIVDCPELPRTSQPTPLEFGELFTRLSQEGYTHVISMHIAEKMSGTVNVARLAAQSAPLEVEVIDTQCNTVAQYLFVRRIAQLRSAGLRFSQLVEKAHALQGKLSTCFMLDTLRNLVMGGRTGKAAGLALSLLNIKPLLRTDELGEVEMFGKVRSLKRAIPKLADLAERLVGKFGPLEGCFVHVRNPEGLAMIEDEFERRGIDFENIGARQTGPVITTHVSVGCVGFSYIPKRVSAVPAP